MVAGSRCPLPLPLAVLLAVVCVAPHAQAVGPAVQPMTPSAALVASPTDPSVDSPAAPAPSGLWIHEMLSRRRSLRRRSYPVPPPAPADSPPLPAPVLLLPPTEDIISSTSTSTAAPARAERSANLSHIAGTGRKIMMYVRNRHLQILPDGTVNGTDDEGSDYVVLQRTSVNKVQVKMQGVATCLFLCMDACGLLYGSRDLTDDCVFNEMLEQHFYNTYSSAKYNNRGRNLYLALDRRGSPRRVQLRPGAPHGRLAAYTRVLTKPVSGDRVAALLARLHGSAGLGAGHRHRGHHSLCPPHGHPEATPRRPLRCPRPRRPHPGPHLPQSRRRHPGGGRQVQHGPRGGRRKCEASEDEDTCQKRLQMIGAKKRKSRNEQDPAKRRNRKTWKQPLTMPTPSIAAKLLQHASASEDTGEVEHDDDEDESDESVTLTTEASTETVEEALMDA